MDTLASSHSKFRFGTPTGVKGYAGASRRFDWLIALLGLWLLGGLCLDGWAHIFYRERIDSFLTPWHSVLYSGVTALATTLTVPFVRNLRRGYHWTRALPQGYLLSLAGVYLFGCSGLLDFGWHSLFGFEVDIEALLSPTHLALAAGGVLVISGPLRAAWLRTGDEELTGWRGLMPALLSLLSVYAVFSFMLGPLNAFGYPFHYTGITPTEDRFLWDIMLISFVLIPTTLTMGFILLAIHRWRLPFGALAMIMTVNAILHYIVAYGFNKGHYWEVLIAALVGGLTGDVLLAVWNPSRERRSALRWFAFLTPFVLYLTYFGILLLTAEIWWRIHMWLGICFMAGVTGLGLSFLYAPPTIPGDDTRLQ